jgi:hypothetical protein
VPARHPGVERALLLVVGAPARAAVRALRQVGKVVDDVVDVDVGESERTDARRVDDPAVVGAVGAPEAQRDRVRGRVPPASCRVVDDARGSQGTGNEAVDQGALADSGVADEDRDLARELGAQGV